MAGGEKRRLRPVAALTCLLATIGVAAGCGPGTGATSWIGEDAAVVRCTVSRRARMSPILLEVPAPALPTGLYARALDPVGLDEMGYQRNQAVCAALRAPTEDEIARAAESIAPMVQLYRTTSGEALRIGQACMCDVARTIGALHLVMACAGAPQASACEVTRQQVTALGQALEPLREAIKSAHVPVLHWRLAGPTDRRDWFSERLGTLIGRHPLGSQIWVPGQAVPRRGNHELVRRLLEVEDVVAVVQQDGGEALLVAREVDRTELVLDHFAHPKLHPKLRGLMAEYDNLHVEDYVAALARPDTPWRPGLDAHRGNLIEVRRTEIERVDRGTIAASVLDGAEYKLRREIREEPPALVERVTLLAPFSGGGEALEVRMELTEEGRMWASAVPDVPLSPTLDELQSAANATPRFQQPPGRFLRFIGRGTPTADVLFHGIHAFSSLMKKVEMEHPSTVQGKATDFDFDLPTGTFAEDLPTREGLRKLRTRISTKPYRLSAKLTPMADAVELTLEPR